MTAKRTVKEELLIYFSSYATHKEYNIAEWLSIKDKYRESKLVRNMLGKK